MNRFSRILAAPMIAGAILAGGLGLAGTAAATTTTTTTNGSTAIMAKPDTSTSHNLTKNTWRQRHHYGHWHRR